MNKLLTFCLLAAGFIAFGSCDGTRKSDNKDTCHIYGTVPDTAKEGKKIYIVPLEGQQSASRVDSAIITNGKFEFEKDTIGMYVIRIDYHYRYDVQDMLVVTEPGTVNVTISNDSHISGTPQNDSLQVWKNLRTNVKSAADLKRLKERTRQMATDLKHGILHDFLIKNT